MMNPEDLRKLLLADADTVISGPWIVTHWISKDTWKRLKALREYWVNATPDELSNLQTLINQQP